jgi:hypothetical protein
LIPVKEGSSVAARVATDASPRTGTGGVVLTTATLGFGEDARLAFVGFTDASGSANRAI